jgi:FAD binding domain
MGNDPWPGVLAQWTTHCALRSLKNEGRGGFGAQKKSIGGEGGMRIEMPSLKISDLPSKTGILIVGAGPTGLALAAELRRLGIETVTVEKIAEGANTSRAAVVHARTLEVLEPLGVVPTMLAEGFKVPVFRVRDRDRALITIDFQEIPSAYAFTLMCPQDRTEAILLARLKSLGGEVIRPAEVTSVDLGASGARVQIAVGDATQTVAARWVIGCDGMHSQVREAAGIAFNGAAYEQGFILADVHMDWPLGRGEVSLFFSPAGLVVVAPLPKDRFRVVATVDDPPEVPSVPYVQAPARRAGAEGVAGPHPRQRLELPLQGSPSSGGEPAQGQGAVVRGRRPCAQSGRRSRHEYRYPGRCLTRLGARRRAWRRRRSAARCVGGRPAQDRRGCCRLDRSDDADGDAALAGGSGAAQCRDQFRRAHPIHRSRDCSQCCGTQH